VDRQKYIAWDTNTVYVAIIQAAILGSEVPVEGYGYVRILSLATNGID
jgi:hypothetical protein